MEEESAAADSVQQVIATGMSALEGNTADAAGGATSAAAGGSITPVGNIASAVMDSSGTGMSASDPATALVTALIFIVLTGLLGGLAAKKLKQPLILGYILSGVFVGIGYRAWFGNEAYVSLQGLANIGVALLLFSMGLEFSKSDIRPIRTVAVWGTLVQVLLTLACAAGIGLLLGLPLTTAMLFGVAFVSTSTAVILKTLTSNGQMGTLSSKVMIGMSIVQDLTVVPLMLIVCNLSNLSQGLMNALKPLATGAVFMFLMMTLGAKLVPWLLKLVARWNSKELFLLAVTGLALGIGFVSEAMQASFSFGAFLAGIVLSDSDYGKKALYEMMPVRDLFAMLFFVSIGMLLDCNYLLDHFPLVAGLLLLTVMSRTLFLSAITWIYGYRNVIPVAMFFGMVPTSEIAFIVIQEGSRPNVNLFDSAVYSLILCIVVCSMILGPAVDNLTSPVYRLLQKTIWKKSPRLDTVTIPEPDLRNHVILAGGGAVGRSIAHLLSRLQLPYIIIDSDHRSFQESQKEKLVAIYGDPQQDVILNSAGIDRAKILLSISSGFSENLSIIRSARMLHPSIPIITLADSAEEVRMLHGYKIYEIVQPKFEAGLEITRQALLRLDVPALEVQNYLDGVRHDQYKPLLDGKADYRLLTRLRSFIGIVELNWVLLPEESFIAGKTLADSRIRSLCGVSVVGAMRDGSFISNPSPDFLLKAGDLLAVIGTAAQRTRFEHLAGAEMAATPAAAGHEVFESAQPAEQHS